MKTMKTIHYLEGLKAYGINLLTGEADAYSRRILCDLSQEGVDLVRTYLGLDPTREAFLSNMNSYVGEAPAVASVMLSRPVLVDLTTFALLHVDHFDYVVQRGSTQIGFNDEDPMAAFCMKDTDKEGVELHHNYQKRSRHPHVGDRNVHAMSGRVL